MPSVVFNPLRYLKSCLSVGLADIPSGDPDPLAALGLRVFLSLVPLRVRGPLLRRCAPCPSNPHWGLSGACWRRLSSVAAARCFAPDGLERRQANTYSARRDLARGPVS